MTVPEYQERYNEYNEYQYMLLLNTECALSSETIDDEKKHSHVQV